MQNIRKVHDEVLAEVSGGRRLTAGEVIGGGAILGAVPGAAVGTGIGIYAGLTYYKNTQGKGKKPLNIMAAVGIGLGAALGGAVVGAATDVMLFGACDLIGNSAICERNTLELKMTTSK